MPTRVVITGMGCITPLGSDRTTIRSAIEHNMPAFCPSPLMPDVTCSPVKEFDLRDYTGRWKHRKYLCRGAQFTVGAALQAVVDAGYTLPLSHSPLNKLHSCSADKSAAPSKHRQMLPEDTAIFCGAGPNLDIGSDFPDIHNGQLDHGDLAALWLLKYLPNTAASAIAQLLDIHGENSTVGTACAASLQAIGQAYKAIVSEDATVALAGGGDSRLNYGAILGYRKAGALHCGKEPVSAPAFHLKTQTSSVDKTAQKACRPFDQSRSGFVPAEGGAMFMLESYEHAQKRNATILGEIKGFSCSIDGHAMTAPDPAGTQAERAILNCLRQAQMSPQDIALISTHGTSTPHNDAMEAALLERLFFQNEPPLPPTILALKSWLGHGAAACGALELAVALSTIPSGCIPHVRGLISPCSQKLKFPAPYSSAETRSHLNSTQRAQRLRKNGQLPLLMENFGFGGQNAALLLTLSTNSIMP